MKSKWLIISLLSIFASSTLTFARNIDSTENNKVSCPSIAEIKGKKLDTVTHLGESEFLVSIKNIPLQDTMNGEYRIWDINVHTTARAEDFNTAYANGKTALESIKMIANSYAKSCGIYCYYCSYLDQHNDVIAIAVTNTDHIVPLNLFTKSS